MKKVFSFCLLAFGLAAVSAQAQSDQQAIRQRADTYLKATEQSDWEKVADMLYPKLFEIAPRDQVMATFRGLEDSGFKVKIYDTAIRNISGPKEYDDQKYAFVDYSMNMDMQLVGESAQGEVAGMLKSQFDAMYGVDNVSYEAETHTFSIRATNTMLALRGQASPEWTFLEYKPEMESLFTTMLGEGMVKQLKSDKQ